MTTRNESMPYFASSAFCVLRVRLRAFDAYDCLRYLGTENTRPCVLLKFEKVGRAPLWICTFELLSPCIS
jgi:hypothetical protein